MNLFRSALYSVYFAVWSVLFSLLFLPVLGWAKLTKNRKLVQKSARIWTGGLVGGLRIITGIRYEVRGQENIPRDAAILAVKHQSMAETFLFHRLVPDSAYVLKQELTRIPIAGWYLLGSGAISVDRKAGGKAARAMLNEAKQRVDEGAQIVIFPEGTRVPPGERRPFQPGVALLYSHTKVPVVPVALNTGLYWEGRSFRKHPGTMVIEFLEPIPPGLPQREFLKLLEDRIDRHCQALLPEALRSPRPNAEDPVTDGPKPDSQSPDSTNPAPSPEPAP
ncbi:1-acyl-sn-glycerol-3-phosphate acyltransferase [Phaeovibrio sulfidiphilus]|uniref:1-acyl-sn-glycerol-3-phosphate acyltransferase n=1 Tax=Phaeovibrio sulfidiphilus TaxID=1220600 RepID=A0A8J6YVM5_9PROT|nr:lysophospholipid acyltransferase family protein [Phaeovibrio sulfidiphilus]MBE1237244.1 1-acyl-sn-glycerol-3-phosphate acyltransferase [Phaeovibrio sulfidiphilus]